MKYRIITNGLFYKVQYRYWPFWITDERNVTLYFEHAEAYVKDKINPPKWKVVTRENG